MTGFCNVSWGMESATTASHPGNFAVPLCSKEGAEMDGSVHSVGFSSTLGSPIYSLPHHRFILSSEWRPNSRRAEQGGANTKTPGGQYHSWGLLFSSNWDRAYLLIGNLLVRHEQTCRLKGAPQGQITASQAHPFLFFPPFSLCGE